MKRKPLLYLAVSVVGVSLFVLGVLLFFNKRTERTVPPATLTVLVKKLDVPAYESPQQTDATSTIRELSFLILEESGSKIKVRDLGVEVWIDKSNTIPLDQAESYFNQRLAENPNQPANYLLRSEAIMQWSKDKSEAENDLLMAVRLDPKFREALLRLGRHYAVRGNFAKGVDYLDRALQIDPEDGVSNYYKGMACTLMRDYEGAIEAYEKAASRGAWRADCLANTGHAWLGLKRHDEAIKSLDAAINIDPARAAFYNHRGNALVEKRDYEKALVDFDAALRLEPESVPALCNRANARKELKQYKGAIDDLEKAENLAPSDVITLTDLAMLLSTCPDQSLRNRSRGLFLAEKACELTRNADPFCLATLAAAWAESGSFDEAVRFQEKALQSKRYRDATGPRGPELLERYRNKKKYSDE